MEKIKRIMDYVSAYGDNKISMRELSDLMDKYDFSEVVAEKMDEMVNWINEHDKREKGCLYHISSKKSNLGG